MGKTNLSKITSDYLGRHTSIAYCLDQGLINYSALARVICDDANVEGFDAVVAACRRYRARRKGKLLQQRKIAALMKRLRLRVRNKIAVVILEKGQYLQQALAVHKLVKKERGDFNFIEGDDFVTIVTNDFYVDKICESFRGAVRRTVTGLVQISMAFDETLETVPGVVAHIYRLLSEAGINIREEMSCWTDVMIIIDEHDLPAALRMLNPG